MRLSWTVPNEKVVMRENLVTNNVETSLETKIMIATVGDITHKITVCCMLIPAVVEKNVTFIFWETCVKSKVGDMLIREVSETKDS